jgi:hypothetical protein
MPLRRSAVLRPGPPRGWYSRGDGVTLPQATAQKGVAKATNALKIS